MSRITIVFVAPLSSDHRGFRRYSSLLLLLLLLSQIFQVKVQIFWSMLWICIFYSI